MPREGKGNLRLVIPGITGNGKGKKINNMVIFKTLSKRTIG